MPRKLRLEYAGACYHVINRGNYRRNLFAAEGTAESFEGCLFESAERFQWLIHAYVVMRNHFHVALETPEPNLSDGMQWLQSTWATRFNRFRHEVGRPFQGRYQAMHVEPGHVLAQVAHYIHLNPVASRVVPAERILEYCWSSLPKFVEKKKRPACLVADTVLRESGGLADTTAAGGPAEVRHVCLEWVARRALGHGPAGERKSVRPPVPAERGGGQAPVQASFVKSQGMTLFRLLSCWPRWTRSCTTARAVRTCR